MQILTVGEIPANYFRDIPILPRGRGNPGTKNSKFNYKDKTFAFDIETTALHEIGHAVMYIWQFQCGLDFTVVGRTWEEYGFLCDLIQQQVDEGERLYILTHNLSYEFSFLKGVYPFTPAEVFCIDRRKILKCSCFADRMEFHCSYLHSNMSLMEYTWKMNAIHKKLPGDDFDYSKRRLPWTPLSREELQYCVHDVLGLVEAFQNEMEKDGDTLYTVPLTSTGYVRRDAKEAMRHTPAGYVKEQLPDIDIYLMLREAFRGGNTHANRYFANITLDGVRSVDMSSAYPYAVCNCLFPVKPFFRPRREMTLPEIRRVIRARKKAAIMRVAIFNISLRNPYWGCPYLSKDKCRKLEDKDDENPPVYDNGRILEAPYLETTITDIDLRIILSEYKFDSIRFLDVAFSTYGKLPPALIETTIAYYRAKTELKDVEGQEHFYMKSKNKLNSIYGMFAQDPVKENIQFIEFAPEMWTEFEHVYKRENEELYRSKDPYKMERIKAAKEAILETHNRHAFLCYQWGLWVTAHVRYRLEYAIKKAHDTEGCFWVYADTDSCKYIGEIDFSEFNADRIAESKASGAFATDPKGNVHYMGVLEDEGEYLQFKTLGAKKYVYSKRRKNCNCVKFCTTIAGVNKKKAPGELHLEAMRRTARNILQGAENPIVTAFDVFRVYEWNEPAFTFRAAGGTESVYNDCQPFVVQVDGRPLRITSNILIKESTYTLGVTDEYKRILENSAELHFLLDRRRIIC